MFRPLVGQFGQAPIEPNNSYWVFGHVAFSWALSFALREAGDSAYRLPLRSDDPYMYHQLSNHLSNHRKAVTFNASATTTIETKATIIYPTTSTYAATTNDKRITAPSSNTYTTVARPVGPSFFSSSSSADSCLNFCASEKESESTIMNSIQLTASRILTAERSNLPCREISCGSLMSLMMSAKVMDAPSAATVPMFL